MVSGVQESSVGRCNWLKQALAATITSAEMKRGGQNLRVPLEPVWFQWEDTGGAQDFLLELSAQPGCSPPLPHPHPGRDEEAA